MDGSLIAKVSMANAGLIGRDLGASQTDWEACQTITTDEALSFCRQAADIFLHDTITLCDGSTQSPEDFVQQQSATTAMPQVMCRQNMLKIHRALHDAGQVLDGLTGGLDHAVLDSGFGKHDGRTVSYLPKSRRLGVILPNNSPGVHALWIPSVSLRIPLALKPGSQEPWTPYRVICALLQAGYPPDCFGFYPADHGAANTVNMRSDHVMIFGDESTVRKWSHDPRVEVHGPGMSKVILDKESSANWQDYIDILADSITANGGRSCINASSIWVDSHAADIADALALKLANKMPLPLDHPDACLAGFSNPRMAEMINSIIEAGLTGPGATDVTSKYRNGSRLLELNGTTFLQPTIVHCDSLDHPLANKEFMFPFASINTVKEDRLLQELDNTLVCTLISSDESLHRSFLNCRHINRLNLGPLPTPSIDWDQPHEGNLFEHLFERRAFQSCPV
jgi:acyl-CoA reductase-like NAD-dependent aldehyde dehydrogenase